MNARSLRLIPLRIAATMAAMISLSANADTRSPEWLQLEVRASDASCDVVEGFIKAEAADGGVLVEKMNGELCLFQPDIIVKNFRELSEIFEKNNVG